MICISFKYPRPPFDPTNCTYRMLLACGARLLIVATLSRLCKLGEPGVWTLRLAESTKVV